MSYLGPDQQHEVPCEFVAHHQNLLGLHLLLRLDPTDVLCQRLPHVLDQHEFAPRHLHYPEQPTDLADVLSGRLRDQLVQVRYASAAHRQQRKSQRRRRLCFYLDRVLILSRHYFGLLRFDQY